MADDGRILNLSSGLTRVSYPGFGAYAAAKGAVEVLSVCLARELGRRGIAVNTVAPGAIETDFLGGAVRDRSGQTLDFHTGRGQVTVAQLHQCLTPVLPADALLISDVMPVGSACWMTGA